MKFEKIIKIIKSVMVLAIALSIVMIFAGASYVENNDVSFKESVVAIIVPSALSITFYGVILACDYIKDNFATRKKSNYREKREFFHL